MNSEQLGQRLKKVREIFNLSQFDVAKEIGVTQVYISRMENGSVKSDFLIRVLEFYSQYISLDRLLNEKNRAALVRELVNGLFETFRKEQDAHIDEIVKLFNLKMDALDEVK